MVFLGRIIPVDGGFYIEGKEDMTGQLFSGEVSIIEHTVDISRLILSSNSGMSRSCKIALYKCLRKYY